MAKYINSSVEDVQFHIENQDFNGPINLLVNMVRESKINIMEVFISEITQQYVNYVKTLKELDYEFVSEYVIFAATLLEIKASKILPQEVEYDENYEELLVTERNILSDLEKELLQSADERLKPLETLNLFYPEPIYDDDDYRLVIKSFDLDNLINAFVSVLEKNEFNSTKIQTKVLEKETFTVAEKFRDITTILRTEGRVMFFDLFHSSYTKIEIINTFLAVLEIFKVQIGEGQQDEETLDIVLVRTKFDTENLTDEEILIDVD